MSKELLTALASLLIALIAAWSARSTQRNAAAASVRVAADTSKADSEREAYMRARQLDTDTIARLERRVDELEAENGQLRRDVGTCRLEVAELQRALRVAVHDDDEGLDP